MISARRGPASTVSDSVDTTGNILETLRRDIQIGRLRPRERLREVEIATRYGTSRSRVREALQMLHAERLVTLRPGQGATVSALSIFEFYDLMELRAALLTIVTRQAAIRASDDELADIVARLEDLSRLTTLAPTESLVVQGSEVGLALARASRNKRAYALLVKLAGRTVWPYVHVATRASDGARIGAATTWDSLRRALVRRDATEAGRLAGDVIRTRRREIIDQLLIAGRVEPDEVDVERVTALAAARLASADIDKAPTEITG